MEALKKAFCENYSDFYNNGYSWELVKEFDERIKENNFKVIVNLFNESTHDFISSDREAAAFMAAFKAVFKDFI